MAEQIVDLAAHREVLLKGASAANAALVLDAIEALAATSPDPRGAVYWFFAGAVRLLAANGAPIELLLGEVRHQFAEALAAREVEAR